MRTLVPTLEPVLLAVTALLVGTCSRVCAGVYARHRAALPSEKTRKRWLGMLVDTSGGTKAPIGALGPQETAAEPKDASLEERVLQEVLEAPTRPLAVLALNELTSDVSRSIEEARTLPPAVGRVALLGGTALGLVAIATTLQKSEGGAAALWGAACLFLGLMGAAVCGMYGRLTRKAAERRREGARELLRHLERRLPSS